MGSRLNGSQMVAKGSGGEGRIRFRFMMEDMGGLEDVEEWALD